MECPVRNTLTRQTVATWLTYAAVFLLPWETRWIYASLSLNAGPWEYGKLSVYAVELLIVAVLVLRGKPELGLVGRRVAEQGKWFLTAVAVSIFLSVQTELSSAITLQVIAAGALLILLLDQRLSTRHLTSAALAGLVAPCVLGWYQVLTGTSPAFKWLGLAEHLAATPGASVVETASDRVLRAYGSFSHPNTFGGILAIALVLVLWRLASESKRVRGWDYAAVVLFASTLVVTFSRSAWIALAVAWVVIAASLLWFRKTLPRRALPMLALCLVAVGFAVIEFQQPIFTRFDPSARLEAMSLDQREGEYGWLPDVVRMNPITGVGIGAYTVALERASPGSPAYAYQPLHDTFLLILAEIGLVGFFALANVVWAAYQGVRNAPRLQNRIFSLALGGLLTVLALLDHYLWTDWAGLAVAAFCLALMVRWSDTEQP